MLRLNSNVPLPPNATPENKLQAAWCSIAVDAHLMAPEGRPTDGFVCGALQYYNTLPHHNKWGAGTAYPVYSHANTLIGECGAVIIEGRYAGWARCSAPHQLTTTDSKATRSSSPGFVLGEPTVVLSQQTMQVV